MHPLVHPAVFQLFRAQTLAKCRRLRKGFSTPRRFVLSMTGVGLGIFYASNILISAFVREPMAPGRFKTLVPLGLLGYVLWDFIKTSCRRPETALHWTRVERERLRTAPLSRRDVLAYRFAGISLAAAAKAIIFSIVMFADIPVYLCGLLGALLALTLIDVLRMLVSITAYSLSNRSFNTIRALTLGATGMVAAKAIGMAWATLGENESATLGSIKLVMALGNSLLTLGQTPLGQAMASPFRVFAEAMTTESISVGVLGSFLSGIVMLVAAIWTVIRLDEHFHQCRVRNERSSFRRERRSANKLPKKESKNRTQGFVSNFGPLNTLVWRQAIGAKNFWGGIVVALVPPSIFSFLPLMVDRDSTGSFYAVVGSLAFYSFILLPSALKFDFRRDFYRMSVLKALPMKTTTVVYGQLACPVLITSLFQVVIVTIAAIVTGNSLSYAAGAMLVLFPMSLAIYGFDNLIFLLYPHPMKQEGIDAFTRTTLTFTGKGLVFAAALCVMVAWAVCASTLTRTLGMNNPRYFFVAGLGILLAALGIASVMANIWAYERFDPSADAIAE